MGVKSFGCICLWNSAVENCSTLVLLGGLDPIGEKLWLKAAAAVRTLVLMELQYLRSLPFLLNEGGALSCTPRLISRTDCTGFRKKLQLFSAFVSAPLQSVALDVVLVLYPETCHLWAQHGIYLVFCLKLFVFLIGLRFWCGNASQLWKIPWLVFSLYNPS